MMFDPPDLIWAAVFTLIGTTAIVLMAVDLISCLIS